MPGGFGLLVRLASLVLCMAQPPAEQRKKRTTLRVRGEKVGETRKVFRTTAGGVGCRAGWRAIEFVSLSYYFRPTIFEAFHRLPDQNGEKGKEKKTRQAGLSASRLGPINGRWQASRTWSPVCWSLRQKSHWGQKATRMRPLEGEGLLHLQRWSSSVYHYHPSTPNPLPPLPSMPVGLGCLCTNGEIAPVMSPCSTPNVLVGSHV